MSVLFNFAKIEIVNCVMKNISLFIYVFIMLYDIIFLKLQDLVLRLVFLMCEYLLDKKNLCHC
jgi:hypothetical protein